MVDVGMFLFHYFIAKPPALLMLSAHRCLFLSSPQAFAGWPRVVIFLFRNGKFASANQVLVYSGWWMENSHSLTLHLLWPQQPVWKHHLDINDLPPGFIQSNVPAELDRQQRKRVHRGVFKFMPSLMKWNFTSEKHYFVRLSLVNTLQPSLCTG